MSTQGFIVLGIGLLRLGWIIEFIPAPAVSGFMTGSAITIAAGQVCIFPFLCLRIILTF